MVCATDVGGESRSLRPSYQTRPPRRSFSVASSRISQTLARHLSARIQNWGEMLKGQAGRLEALSPLAVLSRGYAIAWAGSGQILKSSSQVKSGEEIKVRLHEGEIRAVKK